MKTMVTKDAQDVFNVFRSELNLTFDSESAAELVEKLSMESDFCIEIDGEEFRIIADEAIRDIAQEEIAELVQDCYLSQNTSGPDNELPWWIEIDWNKTVQNCIDADGYGHHFSSYDGNEYETGSWYMFRIN